MKKLVAILLGIGILAEIWGVAPAEAAGCQPPASGETETVAEEMARACAESFTWDANGIKLTLRQMGGSMDYEVQGLDQQDVLKCVSRDEYYTGDRPVRPGTIGVNITGAPTMITWLLVPQKAGEVTLSFVQPSYNRKEPPRCRVKLHVRVDEKLCYTAALETVSES